ncbi:hypothetical protein BDW74DRAFT_181947 [Aspergillus multicolor]|uniref:uncharacterized protein n=1 Tax=Aspergillus multicolor TaxID=41759 RepID=UPI003CCDA5C4
MTGFCSYFSQSIAQDEALCGNLERWTPPLFEPPARDNTRKDSLVSLFIFRLAFSLCKARYWRSPHSAFFDDTHVYDLKYSLYREHEALQYISAYNAQIDEPLVIKALANPVICVAIGTIKRDSVSYLDTSVGSLLAELYPEERSALLANVLFANTKP